MIQRIGQELELRLQGLWKKKSQREMLETVWGFLPDLLQLKNAWLDLDNAALYPPKAQDQERLRKANEAYESYRQVVKRVESSLEEEIRRLEPALLAQERDESQEVEEARCGYALAKELSLTQVAYRFQFVLEAVHARRYAFHPVQKEEGVRLEGLHHRFKGLIEEVLDAYRVYSKKKMHQQLLVKAQALKKEYEQIGCSIWGSYCGELVKIVERRVGGRHERSRKRNN